MVHVLFLFFICSMKAKIRGLLLACNDCHVKCKIEHRRGYVQLDSMQVCCFVALYLVQTLIVLYLRYIISGALLCLRCLNDPLHMTVICSFFFQKKKISTT